MGTETRINVLGTHSLLPDTHTLDGLPALSTMDNPSLSTTDILATIGTFAWSVSTTGTNGGTLGLSSTGLVLEDPSGNVTAAMTNLGQFYFGSKNGQVVFSLANGTLRFTNADQVTFLLDGATGDALFGGTVQIGQTGSLNETHIDASGIYSGTGDPETAPFLVDPQGNMRATSATLSGKVSGAEITGSTVTGSTITGGLIRTAGGGLRWEMSSIAEDTLFAYSGVAEETSPAWLLVNTSGSGFNRAGNITMKSADTGHGVASLQLQGVSADNVNPSSLQVQSNWVMISGVLMNFAGTALYPKGFITSTSLNAVFGTTSASTTLVFGVLNTSTITVTAAIGNVQHYRITGVLNATSTVGQDQVQWQINDGGAAAPTAGVPGTTLQRGDFVTGVNATNVMTHTMVWEGTLSAGSHTFGVAFARAVGTGTVSVGSATAGRFSRLIVEDLGST